MLCPCEFAIHRGIIAGLRPARITNPQLLTRGLQIPEDKRDPRGHYGMVNLQIDHGDF